MWGAARAGKPAEVGREGGGGGGGAGEQRLLPLELTAGRPRHPLKWEVSRVSASGVCAPARLCARLP